MTADIPRKEQRSGGCVAALAEMFLLDRITPLISAKSYHLCARFFVRPNRLKLHSIRLLFNDLGGTGLPGPGLSTVVTLTEVTITLDITEG
jgi:hypothetical protein